ncbi:hypothetical protein ACFLWZ_04220 [Chloroflexota bacterium]
MWAWFTANSIWILFGAGLMLTILLFFRDKFQDNIIKAAPEILQARVRKKASVAFWSIEGVAMAIVVLAFMAITLSREDVHNLITPETIQKWFLEYGTGILIILVVGVALWFALKKFLPPLVKSSMTKPKKGESKEGMKKRADTLLAVLMGLGKIIIIILFSFMIMSELNVPIGPILAGFGIVGIAVGFGAQYLIRDLIAGIFIILEN